MFASIVFLVLICYDYIFIEIRRQFWALSALRLLFIGGVISFIAFSKKLKKPEHYDCAALAMTLVGVIIHLYVFNSRPVSYTMIMAAEPLLSISMVLGLAWEFDLPRLPGIADFYNHHMGLSLRQKCLAG